MSDSSRRGFVQTVIYGLNAIIGAAVAVPSALYLLAGSKKANAEGEWTKVAAVTELPLNAPQEVAYQHVRRDGWKIVHERATAWVVKKSDTDVTALNPRCTHLGCAYHWEEGKGENGAGIFSCPCHSSAFRADGSVISGPAPRSLDRYQSKVEGGVLYVSGLIPGKDV
jgi:menaquinol-cytochrome c reductase iron-sulfur subunit